MTRATPSISYLLTVKLLYISILAITYLMLMDDIEELAEVFKALSDPTRLRLVKLLSDHGDVLCVNALAGRLGITQSAVSQHLRILKQARLVDSDRRGPMVHYSLNEKKFAQHKALLAVTLGKEFV